MAKKIWLFSGNQRQITVGSNGRTHYLTLSRLIINLKINLMKKKFVYLMLLLFVAAPVLQSCGAPRGCKKMRKYRKYTQTDNFIYKTNYVITYENKNLYNSSRLY